MRNESFVIDNQTGGGGGWGPRGGLVAYDRVATKNKALPCDQRSRLGLTVH